MVSAVSQVGQVADVGGLGFLAPVLAFLIVAIILGALLKKTEILGNNPWTSLIVALGISAIFVSVASIRSLVLDVIPWFAVLLLMLFFLLVLTVPRLCYIVGYTSSPSCAYPNETKYDHR